MATTRKNPSLVIQPELLAALDKAAAKRYRNRSDVMREAILLWLRMNGEEIPLPETREEEAS